MPLDAQTKAVVDSIAASGEPPMHTLLRAAFGNESMIKEEL